MSRRCGNNKALERRLGDHHRRRRRRVLNLAVWFALHVLFRELTEVHWGGMKIDVPVLASINVRVASVDARRAHRGVPVQDQHDRSARDLRRDRHRLLLGYRTGCVTMRLR